MSQDNRQRMTSVDKRRLAEIKKACENLINQTQADLEHFMHEQSQLRQQIEVLIEENRHLNLKLEALKATGDACDSRDDATREKLTSHALLNVKKQIDFLEAENSELKSLNKSSRKTIQNLEHEIQNYRNHFFKTNSAGEVKQKYEIAIKLLESTIKSHKTEIVKQAQLIENLIEEKKHLKEHIRRAEAALIERERASHQSHAEQPPATQNSGTAENGIVERLQMQLQDATRHNKELETSLRASRRVIEERFEHEKCALQKVQEALSIAEAAVADKEEAQKREQVMKEECDNLASTIGQVMEEAARKVEKDMKELRKKFEETEKGLLSTQEQLKEELQNQRKFSQILETRCARFQDRYKTAQKEVENLKQQLEVAQNNLKSMEFKINQQARTLREDEIMKRHAVRNESEIQRYIETNKELKEKYKAALEEVTAKCKDEIYGLQQENANLKAEIQVIRLQGAMPMMMNKAGLSGD